MPYSLPASLLDVELQPRKPPILRADTAGDVPGWAAEQREALRAVVAEHGAVLVRGLHLRNAPEISAVFRQLSTGLMIEKEAFAARRIYSDGVYSSATWPTSAPHTAGRPTRGRGRFSSEWRTRYAWPTVRQPSR